MPHKKYIYINDGCKNNQVLKPPLRVNWWLWATMGANILRWGPKSVVSTENEQKKNDNKIIRHLAPYEIDSSRRTQMDEIVISRLTK